MPTSTRTSRSVLHGLADACHHQVKHPQVDFGMLKYCRTAESHECCSPYARLAEFADRKPARFGPKGRRMQGSKSRRTKRGPKLRAPSRICGDAISGVLKLCLSSWQRSKSPGQGTIAVKPLVVVPQGKATRLPHGLAAIEDTQGWLKQRFDACSGSFYLLRPDRHARALAQVRFRSGAGSGSARHVQRLERKQEQDMATLGIEPNIASPDFLRGADRHAP